MSRFVHFLSGTTQLKLQLLQSNLILSCKSNSTFLPLSYRFRWRTRVKSRQTILTPLARWSTPRYASSGGPTQIRLRPRPPPAAAEKLGGASGLFRPRLSSDLHLLRVLSFPHRRQQPRVPRAQALTRDILKRNGRSSGGR